VGRYRKPSQNLSPELDFEVPQTDLDDPQGCRPPSLHLWTLPAPSPESIEHLDRPFSSPLLFKFLTATPLKFQHFPSVNIFSPRKIAFLIKSPRWTVRVQVPEKGFTLHRLSPREVLRNHHLVRKGYLRVLIGWFLLAGVNVKMTSVSCSVRRHNRWLYPFPSRQSPAGACYVARPELAPLNFSSSRGLQVS